MVLDNKNCRSQHWPTHIDALFLVRINRTTTSTCLIPTQADQVIVKISILPRLNRQCNNLLRLHDHQCLSPITHTIVNITLAIFHPYHTMFRQLFHIFLLNPLLNYRCQQILHRHRITQIAIGPKSEGQLCMYRVHRYQWYTTMKCQDSTL